MNTDEPNHFVEGEKSPNFLVPNFKSTRRDILPFMEGKRKV